MLNELKCNIGLESDVRYAGNPSRLYISIDIADAGCHKADLDKICQDTHLLLAVDMINQAHELINRSKHNLALQIQIASKCPFEIVLSIPTLDRCMFLNSTLQ